jgi:photosystem II stability/assembly factor-like uncharacterized protein
MELAGVKVGMGLLVASLLATPAWSDQAPAPPPRPAEMMPKAAESILLDVAVAGPGYVAVGEYGNIVVSHDGRQWTQVGAPVRAMLNRVRFIDNRTGWAVGHDGVILHTSDGGMHWSLQARDADKGLPFYDILFLDDHHGFAVGARSMFRETSDGGATWTDVDAPFLKLGLNLNAIVRLRDGSLMIGGEKGLVARSVDQGRSWTMLKSPYPGSWFGILPDGPRGALLFGLRGHVFAIDDPAAVPLQDPQQWDEFNLPTISDAEGQQRMGWRAFTAPNDQSLFGGALIDEQHFVLVGVNGTVLRGMMSNPQLISLAAPSDASLSAIVIHNGHAVAVGHDGAEVIEGGFTP